MNGINVHNYESWFLLYTDRELDAAGKQAVEDFVVLHPELAEELERLQLTRLPDEVLPLADKSFLYRTEVGEINLQNYEEQFLLYVDNELDAAALEQTERFVLQHPQTQAAFTALKATKLPQEQILFPDKSVLYREEKTRPVLYLRWQQIAVAAALIGFAIITWWMLPADKNAVTPATELAGTQSSVISPQQATGNPITGNRQPATESAVINTTAASNQIKVAPGNTITSGQAPASSGNTSADLLASNTVNANRTPLSAETVAQSRNVNEQNTNTVENTLSPVSHTEVTPAETKAADMPDGSTTVTNVQPVRYKELDTEADDEKRTLLLGSLEINKDKLRGFFRKAGSLFRSKNRTEEDKPDNKTTRSLR
jgi:hypothetical protein